MTASNLDDTHGAIKVLLFDVFGTLVDWRRSMIGHLSTFGLRHDILADWAAIADDWRDQYQPLLSEVRTGRREYVPLDILHREGLLSVLNHHGIQGIGSAAIDELNAGWHDLVAWPDVIDGFEQLRRQVVLINMSNADLNMSINIARNAGIRWDMILGAEPVRMYKPRPEVYLHAVGATGLRPDQIMMVAAHNHDLEAAASLGMRTAFVRRPTEYGRGQTTDLSPTGDWDVVCEDLHALSEHLERLRGSAGHGGESTERKNNPRRAAPRLSRIRALTIVAVVAGTAALAFSQGYQFGRAEGITVPAGSSTGLGEETPEPGQPDQ